MALKARPFPGRGMPQSLKKREFQDFDWCAGSSRLPRRHVLFRSKPRPMTLAISVSVVPAFLTVGVQDHFFWYSFDKELPYPSTSYD